MKEKVKPMFLQIGRLSSFSPKHLAQIDQKTLPGLRITHRTTKT
jgi:hypothetical protein